MRQLYCNAIFSRRRCTNIICITLLILKKFLGKILNSIKILAKNMQTLKFHICAYNYEYQLRSINNNFNFLEAATFFPKSSLEFNTFLLTNIRQKCIPTQLYRSLLFIKTKTNFYIDLFLLNRKLQLFFFLPFTFFSLISLSVLQQPTQNNQKKKKKRVIQSTEVQMEEEVKARFIAQIEAGNYCTLYLYVCFGVVFW